MRSGLSCSALLVVLPILVGCGAPVGPAGGIATITVTPSAASIAVNQTQQFTVQARDSAGNPVVGVTFTWSSSNPSFATVDAGGLAKGVAQGQATITAASGTVSGTATLTVTPPKPILTVTKSGTGTGSVTSSPGGLTCGAICSASFNSGTTVTLTATPDSGSTFVGWSGGGCSGTGTCTVTLTADISVTATFNLVSVGGTASPTVGNNSALLSGAAIGRGTAAVAVLRKQIAVAVMGQDASFSVGTAFAARSSTSNDFAFVALPVTNTGSQDLCFVKLTGLAYRDAGGAVLLSGEFTFVQGSVRKLSTLFTDTCLAPGETGQALDIKENLYSAVAKMEFTLESMIIAGGAPSARVIPQSYTFKATTDSLEITVANLGSSPALVGEINRFHRWLLLDDAGQPLFWNLTDFAFPGIVPASGTATISDKVFYDGSGSKLLVFVDFEDASGVSTKPAPAPGGCAAFASDALTQCRHKTRNLSSAIIEDNAVESEQRR